VEWAERAEVIFNAVAFVICADGTGNTSSTGVSNVYRLIELLALDDPSARSIYSRRCSSTRMPSTSGDGVAASASA
jgi:hypothetical protein